MWGAFLEAAKLVSHTAQRTQNWYDCGAAIAHCRSPTSSRCRDKVKDLDEDLSGSMRIMGFVRSFLNSLQGPGQYSNLSMLGFMQKSCKALTRIKSVDRKDRVGQKAHRLAKEITGWLCRITRDLYHAETCPGTDHMMYGPMHQPFDVEDKARIFEEMQVLLECQLRVVMEQALFSSKPELEMCERSMSVGNLVLWLRNMEDVKAKEESVNERKAAFLEREQMPWIEKLQKKCPGRYQTHGEVLQLFYGLGEDDVLTMISRIRTACTPVEKVRLWSDAILGAIKAIMQAMPPGTEPLGGPDLPQVALFLLCHSGLDIYSHAKLAELFTLGYDGYDKEEFRLAEGGLYTEVHEQYTYNAERRSIYPQMMLNYLVEGCEIIAASKDCARRDTRSAVVGAWDLPENAPGEEQLIHDDPVHTLIATAAVEAKKTELKELQGKAFRERMEEKDRLKTGLPFDVWR